MTVDCGVSMSYFGTVHSFLPGDNMSIPNPGITLSCRDPN
jgi:hypothetical protein